MDEQRPRETETPRRRRAGRVIRRAAGRGAAGLAKMILQPVITAVIILAVIYFGWKYLPDVFSSRTEITDLVAESRLEAIGEFATYEYTYTDVKEKWNSRYLLENIQIPGTTNYQKYAYTGVIKVGYQVADMKIHVDNLRKEIYVTLPDPQVLSNTIEQDTSYYQQSNNILNPIRGDAVAAMEQEVKQEELAKAEAKGIYTLAEEHARELITNLLSSFEGYKVVFW